MRRRQRSNREVPGDDDVDGPSSGNVDDEIMMVKEDARGSAFFPSLMTTPPPPLMLPLPPAVRYLLFFNAFAGCTVAQIK